MRITKNRSAFTLLEALFAVMLIGMVIVALVASSAAFTMTNSSGVDLSTAEFLIEQVRELSTASEYNKLPFLAGTYNPPRDVNNAVLTDFNAYSQVVSVASCGTQFGGAANDFLKITVQILKNGKPIAQSEWIRSKPQ